LPAWEEFDEPDLRDHTVLSEGIPEPTRVAYDVIALANEERRTVPATLITCEFGSEVVGRLVAEGHPYFAEVGRLSDYEVVDLPTGHWPQFTRPRELGEAILAAISRQPNE
jgi:pimeloyl-ACP methyl ester carboxylesterase